MILWFGIGEEGKVFLVTIGVLFPVYVNTLHGIRSVDQGLMEMGRIYGLHSWSLFWQVVLPGALPSILVGVLCVGDYVVDVDRGRDDCS